MILDMDRTEADIKVLFDARNKYEKCKNIVHLNGQLACTLFYYNFDSNFDILSHCSSCKFNTKKPTAFSRQVRFP